MRISQADYQSILARQCKQPERTQSSFDREAELHAQIIKECMKRGWPFIHNRMDRASTATEGAPDFVILGVYSSRGSALDSCTNSPQVYFIEAKTKTGKLSIAQLGFQAQAEKFGHTVHVVRSLEEFLKVIE